MVYSLAQKEKILSRYLNLFVPEYRKSWESFFRNNHIDGSVEEMHFMMFPKNHLAPGIRFCPACMKEIEEKNYGCSVELDPKSMEGDAEFGRFRTLLQYKQPNLSWEQMELMNSVGDGN